MEFIHCCAPTSIILTKLTGRLMECWTLFMSPTFPPSLRPSLMNARATLLLWMCLFTFAYVTCVKICTHWHGFHHWSYVCAAFLICLQVSGGKHVIWFPLNPAIIFIQSSAAHYLMVHRNSSMSTVEIGFTRHRTHKEETETERRSQISVNYHQAFIVTL